MSTDGSGGERTPNRVGAGRTEEEESEEEAGKKRSGRWPRAFWIEFRCGGASRRGATGTRYGAVEE
jgi:hypothetical protein